MRQSQTNVILKNEFSYCLTLQPSWSPSSLPHDPTKASFFTILVSKIRNKKGEKSWSLQTRAARATSWYWTAPQWKAFAGKLLFSHKDNFSISTFSRPASINIWHSLSEESFIVCQCDYIFRDNFTTRCASFIVRVTTKLNMVWPGIENSNKVNWDVYWCQCRNEVLNIVRKALLDDRAILLQCVLIDQSYELARLFYNP